MRDKAPWFAAFILLLGINIGFAINYYNESKAPEPEPVQPAPLMEEEKPISIDVPEESETTLEDDPVAGNNDAKVTIIEYSDYECFYCKKFYEESFLQIRKDYIDTGKVKYIYKDYPLHSHINTEEASYAANCAGEQHNYWNMHDKLFEMQNDWTNKENVNEIFINYTSSMEIDKNEFRDCLESGKFIADVADDIEEGQELDVRGTPTVFINERKIEGAYPYDTFKSAIEHELNAAEDN